MQNYGLDVGKSAYHKESNSAETKSTALRDLSARVGRSMDVPDVPKESGLAQDVAFENDFITIGTCKTICLFFAYFPPNRCKKMQTDANRRWKCLGQRRSIETRKKGVSNWLKQFLPNTKSAAKQLLRLIEGGKVKMGTKTGTSGD